MRSEITHLNAKLEEATKTLERFLNQNFLVCKKDELLADLKTHLGVLQIKHKNFNKKLYKLQMYLDEVSTGADREWSIDFITEEQEQLNY